MEEVRSSIGEATTSFGAAVESELGIGRRGRIEDEAVGRVGEGNGNGDGESPRRGKLLFGVANVGGSLTVLLQIALVAWGIRRLRSMLENRRLRLEKKRAEAAASGSERRDMEETGAMQSSTSSAVSSSRPVDQVPFAVLSPVAVKRLVELDPVRYVFVDVRFPDAVKESPAPFEAVLNIPESELSDSLQLSEAEWESRYPSVRKIGLSDLIVFLSTKGDEAQRAANVAAGLGYSGCCILSGGIEAYSAAMSIYEDVPLKFLSRDAVATILEKHHMGEDIDEPGSSSVHLLDVRRHDERTNFGHIKGSLNIPVAEFPKALTLDEDAWEKSYHFPKIAEDDAVIFQCLTNGRASWAAQLAQDAGFKRCFVYKDGVLGWRLDPTVQPYKSYKAGGIPPDPIKFEVETPDHDAAKEELQKLGLG
ncbi:unnamed protein product [Calypogeia fissa]